MAERTSRDPYNFGTDFDPTGRTSRTQPPPVGGWGTAAPVDYGDMTRAPRTPDPFAVPVAAPIVPPGSTYPQYPYTPPEAAPAPVTPAGPAAFAGSPLNTLYGIDSESYLTEDQRKLARMIQGKFDSSMNRRDRELAQYGAPRLASFTEDEALARAMSLARGLNIPVKDALGMVQGSGPASRGGGGSGGGGPGGGSARAPALTTQRAPADPRVAAAKTTPPGASPSQAAKWQQILGGLTSIMPLLLGKEGMNEITNKGLIKWIGDALKSGYESVFGAPMTPMQTFEVMQEAGLTNGAFPINPITGMPMNPMPLENFNDPLGMYGPGSGWGGVEPTITAGPTVNDVPWWEGGDYGGGAPITDVPWWEGGDYGGGGAPITDVPWWEGGDYGGGSYWELGADDLSYLGDFGY